MQVYDNKMVGIVIYKQKYLPKFFKFQTLKRYIRSIFAIVFDSDTHKSKNENCKFHFIYVTYSCTNKITIKLN